MEPAISMWQILTTTTYGKSHRKGDKPFAGSSCGLDLHVVLAGTKSEQNPASQAIFSQCDTTLHYVPEGESALADVYSHLVESLKFKRNAVYKLHPGGSDSIGALAYIHTFHDILDFSHRTEVNFFHIIHSISSAGIQTGLVLGQCKIHTTPAFLG